MTFSFSGVECYLRNVIFLVKSSNQSTSYNNAMAKMSLQTLERTVVACRLCPRLVAWREQVAHEKRKAFRDEEYWGKPVPSFGAGDAKLLVCGLAPAAHGGNRTGRVFTGDRSGDWLYGALFRAGFANQPQSTRPGDGLKLRDCRVTACVRCAPPGNKPTPAERDTCLKYLIEEVRLLTNVKVIVCLGAFAWNGVLKTLNALGHRAGKKPLFGHAAEAKLGPYVLIGSYHPSQQNTFTGRLTEVMLDQVFNRARELRDK
jgi:uracil-DNA glycosylase